MIHQLQHPLVKDLVNRLRSSSTDAVTFQSLVAELSRLLAYNALSELPTPKKTIKTWRGNASYHFIEQDELVLVPILRAGLPMLTGLTVMFSQSPNGFLAMRRDEQTHQAKTYYDRIPDCVGKTVVILDPMVATGGSLNDAITLIKNKQPKNIVSLNIIGSILGLKNIEDQHPDVEIYIAQIDEELDSNMFIQPGLGDAGDRAFNTPE